MANIIDALLITLGLDTKDFKKGQKEAEDGLDKLSNAERKRAKDADEASKAMVQGLNKAKNELISLLAVVAGATTFKEFVSAMVTGQASLARSAKNLGTSAKELDAWGAAIETVGGKKADLLGTAQGLAGIYEAIKAGKADAGALSAMSALGLGLDDLQDPSKAFAKINRGLQNSKLTEQDKLFFAKALGLDEATFNLLRQQPEKVEALVAKMRALSGVSDETAAASGRLQAAWATLTQGASGVGGAIYREMIPALEEMLKFVNFIAEALVRLDGLTGGWTSKIIAATVGIVGLATAVKGLLALRAAGAAVSAAGVAGAGAAAGKLATAGTVGAVGVAGAFAGWELFRLGSALKDWWDVKHREGVVLSKRATDEVKAAEAAPAALAANLPRGIRNNNPGNLNFAGQSGATREDGPGRFARFGTMEEGVGALVRQLRLYAKRGINTIRGIVNKYAPASENNVGAYISALVKATGLGADDPLNLDDEATVKSLVRGITTHENGRGYLTEQQITGGIRIGAGAALAGGGPGTKVETNIQQVTIHTNERSAPGIARDLSAELQQQTALAANNGYAM